jgi:hypothetical protein
MVNEPRSYIVRDWPVAKRTAFIIKLFCECKTHYLFKWAVNVNLCKIHIPNCRLDISKAVFLIRTAKIECFSLLGLSKPLIG